jgi:multisubunit Na+/H+ antiporter MnhF subunit
MTEIHAKEPMTMCPMASMCRGIVAKPPSRLLLMIPGLTLILVGLLILLEPKVLIWLMATVALILGVLALVIGNAIHRFSIRLQDAHS